MKKFLSRKFITAVVSVISTVLTGFLAPEVVEAVGTLITVVSSTYLLGQSGVDAAEAVTKKSE